MALLSPNVNERLIVNYVELLTTRIAFAPADVIMLNIAHQASYGWC